jgi:hypothetical protein
MMMGVGVFIRDPEENVLTSFVFYEALYLKPKSGISFSIMKFSRDLRLKHVEVNAQEIIYTLQKECSIVYNHTVAEPR